jgi:hypothetical protein
MRHQSHGAFEKNEAKSLRYAGCTICGPDIPFAAKPERLRENNLDYPAKMTPVGTMDKSISIGWVDDQGRCASDQGLNAVRHRFQRARRLRPDDGGMTGVWEDCGARSRPAGVGAHKK